MNNLIEILNENDKIILDVSMYYKNDLVVLNGVKFDVFDYSIEDDYLRLIQENGSEMIMPINEITYIEEDDTWIYEDSDVELFIFVDNIN